MRLEILDDRVSLWKLPQKASMPCSETITNEARYSGTIRALNPGKSSERCVPGERISELASADAEKASQQVSGDSARRKIVVPPSSEVTMWDLLAGVLGKKMGSCHCVKAALCFSFVVYRKIEPGVGFRARDVGVKARGKATVDLGYGGLGLRQDLIEVGNLFDGALRVVAEAVAGLHRFHQHI